MAEAGFSYASWDDHDIERRLHRAAAESGFKVEVRFEMEGRIVRVSSQEADEADLYRIVGESLVG